MPTYEYRCPKCGDFEVVQRITEDALLHCPACGAPVHRLIGRNIGVVFKGSGFYCTDNRKKPAGEEASESESPVTSKDKSA
ncbi:MAG: FmdB family zinc ribbon protein [Bacillota bacterium]